MRRAFIAVLVLLGAGFVAAPADAALFTGSDAYGRSASVTFAASGSNLIVTLDNTATYDSGVPTDILTAVYFDIVGVPSLTRISATLGVGATVKGNGGLTDPGGVVGGEWAYLSGISVQGASQGISSTGMGVFGPGDRFPGNDLESPASPDGIQYGITTANDLAANDNGGISGTGLIQHSAVFTLSGLPGGFSDANSSFLHVTFQYGTALTEPTVPGTPNPPPPPPENSVPEPVSMVAWSMLALAGLCYRARRSRRAA